MEESLVIFYAAELLRALAALHAAGFIHADVKPDNVRPARRLHPYIAHGPPRSHTSPAPPTLPPSLLRPPISANQVLLQCPDPANVDVSLPIAHPDANWGAHRPVLLDFGRSIDVRCAPHATTRYSSRAAHTGSHPPLIPTSPLLPFSPPLPDTTTPITPLSPLPPRRSGRRASTRRARSSPRA